MDDMTFEELIEERRATWSAACSASGYRLAASEEPAGPGLDAPQLDVLEDTIPLPAYRPERL